MNQSVLTWGALIKAACDMVDHHAGEPQGFLYNDDEEFFIH